MGLFPLAVLEQALGCGLGGVEGRFALVDETGQPGRVERPGAGDEAAAGVRVERLHDPTTLPGAFSSVERLYDRGRRAVDPDVRERDPGTAETGLGLRQRLEHAVVTGEDIRAQQ